MSKKDLVSEEVLQELTNKIQEIVNNYCWNLEYFTPTEIEGFFDGTQQEEIDYYSSLIKDDVVSKNFLHSSKQIADDIAQSIIEANGYTDNMIKNISSIQLKWCETSLPASGDSNTIYILKASDNTAKDTLNLYNTTDGWTSIGDFSISMDDYYTKEEVDEKLNDKANSSEVVGNDKIMQTLDSTTNSSDTVLSTSGLQTEMDKKANDDEVIKKTDITTSIDSTSTNEQIAGALAIYNNLSNKQSILKHNLWTLDDLNKTDRTEVSYGYISNDTAVSIGITDATDYFHIIYLPWDNPYPTEILITCAGQSRMYLRSCSNGTWSDPKEILTQQTNIVGHFCLTNVADVPQTNITYNDEINYTNKSYSDNHYYVINGICYVRLYIGCVTPTNSNSVIASGLPKPKNGSKYKTISKWGDSGNDFMKCTITSTGDLIFRYGTTGVSYIEDFSYPVAES